MKDAFVADSSLAVSWAVLSQSSQATAHLLNEVASGTPFVVPVLWMSEVANALLVLVRRKRIEPGEYTRARGALGRLTPVVDDDGPRRELGKISDLAANMDFPSMTPRTWTSPCEEASRLPLATRI